MFRNQQQREAVKAIVLAIIRECEAQGWMAVSEETLNKAVDAYLILVQPPVNPSEGSFKSEDYVVDTSTTHEDYSED